MFKVKVRGIVALGTQAASGISYFQELGGTINVQREFFHSADVDMTGIYNGTINVCIAPCEFRILKPDYIVRDVHWHHGRHSEDFSFVHCLINYEGSLWKGYLYYPHPETKLGKFPGYTIMEILAPLIPDLHYGNAVEVYFVPESIQLLAKALI